MKARKIALGSNKVVLFSFLLSFGLKGAHLKYENDTIRLFSKSVWEINLPADSLDLKHTSEKRQVAGKKTLIFDPVLLRPEPGLEDIKKHQLPFYISGFIDTYYLNNLNHPLNGSNTGICGAARALDREDNQFQLGMAQTKLRWSTERVNTVIDLVIGSNAERICTARKIEALCNDLVSPVVALKQAYISYKPDMKNEISVGQFGTHIGYEFVESYANFNYSHSNLFTNSPYYHLGIKYTHYFTNTLSVMAGVVNSGDYPKNNRIHKSFIGHINYKPYENISVTLNYIGGNVVPTNYQTQNRIYSSTVQESTFKQLLNLTLYLKTRSKFQFGIDASFGSSKEIRQPDAKSDQIKSWGGVAFYSNYQVTNNIGFCLRTELFDNTSGIQQIGKTDVQSYTATFHVRLDQNFYLKPELRTDIYKKNHTGPGSPISEQFMDHHGVYSRNKQTTIGAALIYKF